MRSRIVIVRPTPARAAMSRRGIVRTTLVRAAVLLGAVAIMPGRAHAQPTVNEGVRVPSGALVHVRLQSGSVRITGWAHDSVHVSGRLAPGESWTTRVHGDTVRLRADDMPRGLSAPSELEIHVPMTSPLMVRAAAASLVVKELDAAVDVATAGGNLLVEAVRAPVRAETMQGTLTVIGPAPRVEASTANGELFVSVPYDTLADGAVVARRGVTPVATTSAFGTVVLRSVSGRITFDAPHADSAAVHTVRGDVRLRAMPSGNGTVHVTSHVGLVTVGWRDEADAAVNAVVDARTSHGGVRGRVPSRAADTGAPADVDALSLVMRAPDGVRFQHAFGAGGVLTVRAVRSDIVFERAVIPPVKR